jgi:hypothetical protein
LSSANGYTGTTTLASGTLNLNAVNAIPSGSALTLIGGTLQAASSFPTSTSLTLPNAVTFNNSAVTFAGANPLVFSGTVTLNGANELLTIGNTGGTTFSGQLVGAGGLTELGAGTLILTNALGNVSTFTGPAT